MSHSQKHKASAIDSEQRPDSLVLTVSSCASCDCGMALMSCKNMRSFPRRCAMLSVIWDGREAALEVLQRVWLLARVLE